MKMKSRSKPVTNHASILGPILFNFFIKDLDDGSECTLSKFASDLEPRMADIPEGCAAIHADMLEKWASRNLVQFPIKGKCQVLHQGVEQPQASVRVGNHLTRKQFAENDLGVLVETALNMGHQYVLAARKANSILSYTKRSVASGQGRRFFPFVQHW